MSSQSRNPIRFFYDSTPIFNACSTFHSPFGFKTALQWYVEREIGRKAQHAHTTWKAYRPAPFVRSP